MKTLSEIKDWCTGVAIECGDASLRVGQMFARFVAEPSDDDNSILAAWNDNQLHIDFGGDWLPIPVDTDGPRINRETGDLEAFGIEQICPGFWTLTPSLNIPGFIHVYVHVFDVPKPAPWEQIIIIPGGDYRGLLTRILEGSR